MDTMAIREYVLPHDESRPRRVAITSDDVIWYSDYSRGYLGRYDPATGSERMGFARRPQSQPYGIVAVNDVIWYSEVGVAPNTVVCFDPKTKKFQTGKFLRGRRRAQREFDKRRQHRDRVQRR